jgi:hypothetical protein
MRSSNPYIVHQAWKLGPNGNFIRDDEAMAKRTNFWPYDSQEAYDAAWAAVEQLLGDRFANEGKAIRSRLKRALVMDRCLTLEDLLRHSRVEMLRMPHIGTKVYQAMRRSFPEWTKE